MAHGFVTLERDPVLFQSINPTTSTGISTILLNPERRDGVAQAGAATSVTLKSTESALSEIFTNWTVRIVSGTGKDQERVITAYNGSTKVATVATWETNPDNTSYYWLIPPTVLAAQEALISVEDFKVRWRGDGGAPTATVGHVIYNGTDAVFKGAQLLKKLRFIDTADGASTIRVTLFY